ncbi:MAG: glycosyl hydrolase [Bacteroides sp.]|nr:glycosyl hydrolase [Bacteroides sp.]
MNLFVKAVIAFSALTISVQQTSAQVYLDDTAAIEDRVDDALSRMTAEEKVALLHAYGKFASSGVPRLGIPQLMMSDGPHGVRAEINWNDWKYAGWTCDSATAFPALTALAATWNPELSALYGKSVGEEARYRGKDVLLGPGVNIYRTPLNGRNFEYMGEDPCLASVMVVPYIQELQKNGVAACVKHFALNNQEQWRGEVDVNVSDRALYEIYLPAFKAAVQQGGAWSIMGAYNKYQGEHACHNHRLLVDILRGEWGFDGAVITDWGGAHDTGEAALNGLDIEMGSYTNGLTSESKFGYDDYYLAGPYLAGLRDGIYPDSTLNAKAANVLRLIFRTSMNRNKPYGALASPEHYNAAKGIADEAVVLMKNSGILPLDTAAQDMKILVVGENAIRNLNEGGGSSDLKVKDMFTPLESLQKRFGNVTYAKGYISGRPRYGKEDIIPQPVLDSLRNEAVGLARKADVVIYIGGLNKNGFQDCESTDRREYNLPWQQDMLISELAAANPNIIVANISGNAYAMPWLDQVPAVVQSWYLGTMIGESMADVLTGKVNPSGHLPFSFPACLEDLRAHSAGAISYPGVTDADGSNPRQEYTDDIFVGYRGLERDSISPLMPFGHGLSYTTFEFGEPSLSQSVLTEGGNVTLTVQVSNIGRRAGAEVVQVYVADGHSSVPRPVKELKAFSKVYLNPGQTKTLHFDIDPSMLAYFDESTHSWKVEPGRFDLLIGSSSADIRASVMLIYQ